MPPIARVERSLYYPHDSERGAACISSRYIGSGLQREERLAFERYDDWQEGHRVRVSNDNGRTWSDWRVVHEEWPLVDGLSKEETPFAYCYDPVSARYVQFVFQRLTVGRGEEAIARSWRLGEQTYFDHVFYRTSADNELSWNEPHQLRYEEGPMFDPQHWGVEAYLRSNQMYGAYEAIGTRAGTVVFPSAEVPMDVTERGTLERVHGLLVFVGRWDPAIAGYRWERSQPLWVPHRVSGRGLQEPAIAELADGRLMLVMRGSNRVHPPNWQGTVENGGHKWTATSSDGGLTWSHVTALCYDTGEPFYSPASLARLLRHPATGRLYCLLNISAEPTAGNSPRYPLYLAEVDEQRAAIKRDSLAVIDDRDPQSDTEQVQFSNFSMLIDRETGRLELYMTRYGERADWRMADAWKYTITML
ncbi:MAG: exo-alpha-sialidase [Chloroflexi bacterium]|nr:exo-alpha-sialidase [Chloroflexota bacterium]